MTKKRVDNITLALKKEWFEMINIGTKKEEYRDINDYWCKRFLRLHDNRNHIDFPSEIKKFTSVTFTLGYPHKDDMSRRITFKNPHIRVGEGREEWGAKKGETYFVISWEDRI